MFTDLAGSTALRSNLGERGADELPRDEARREVDRIGLPALLPRVDELAAQLEH